MNRDEGTYDRSDIYEHLLVTGSPSSNHQLPDKVRRWPTKCRYIQGILVEHIIFIYSLHNNPMNVFIKTYSFVLHHKSAI